MTEAAPSDAGGDDSDDDENEGDDGDDRNNDHGSDKDGKDMVMMTSVTVTVETMMIKRTVTLVFMKTMGCLPLADRQNLVHMAKA